MKIVINRCYGGFALSARAYERLIALGIPVRQYVSSDGGSNSPKPMQARADEVIFDATLSDPPRTEEDVLALDVLRDFGKSRYFDSWSWKNRAHPLLIRVVEELGEAASGVHAQLEVIEIPSGVEYEICDTGGKEWVAEAHRKWP